MLLGVGAKPVLSVESSRTINVPAARAYRALTDLGRWLEWVYHFRALTPLTDGPLAPWFRVRIALKLVPFASTWEVTEVVPGRSFSWTYSLPGIRFVFHHIVEVAGGGSRVVLRADLAGPLAFLGWPLSPCPRITGYLALAALGRMLEAEVAG